MHPANRSVEGVPSILADMALSAWDEALVGTESEPHVHVVDEGAVQRVAAGVGDDPPWNRDPESAVANRFGGLVAPYMYLWTILNNTPTYRRYEHWVMHEMEAGTAHLHVGDDYRYLEPIRPGDRITCRCRIDAVREKRGSQGRLVFLDDTWTFVNQHGRDVARLTCKAVTLYRERSGEGTPPSRAPDGVGRGQEWREGTPAPRLEQLAVGDPIPVFEHRLSMRENILWMAAVDDYAYTHYDPDYALEHGFPGGRSLLAGPHLGGVMVADVARWLGEGGWIREVSHIQRHGVGVGAVVRVAGRIARLDPGPHGPTARVEAWLLDGEDRVLNTAELEVETALPVGVAQPAAGRVD